MRVLLVMVGCSLGGGLAVAGMGLAGWIAGRRLARWRDSKINVIGEVVLPEVGDPRWVVEAGDREVNFRLGNIRVTRTVGVGLWQIFVGLERVSAEKGAEAYGRALEGRFWDARREEIARLVQEEVEGAR